MWGDASGTLHMHFLALASFCGRRPRAISKSDARDLVVPCCRCFALCFALVPTDIPPSGQWDERGRLDGVGAARLLPCLLWLCGARRAEIGRGSH
jgi:hypothetical protein